MFLLDIVLQEEGAREEEEEAILGTAFSMSQEMG